MKKYEWKKFAGKGTGRKKCAAALLAAAVMLLSAGCGEEEKVIDGSVQNVQMDASDSTADASGADGGQGTEGEGSGNAQGSTGAQTTGKGYVFTVNGTTVEMDADAEPILEALGEPVSYFEAESCAFEGMDKMYTYNGFELDTYPKGNKDYVSTVILKDDSVVTAEGIGIGDTLEKLQQAYPEGGTEDSGMIIYEKGGMKLCFILNEDEIISIEYRSNVL